jgi:hypothetical protein
MFPTVAGTWFHTHQVPTVMGAPATIPAGITNMFTTECS